MDHHQHCQHHYAAVNINQILAKPSDTGEQESHLDQQKQEDKGCPSKNHPEKELQLFHNSACRISSMISSAFSIPTLNRNTLSNIEILEPPSALQAQYGAIAETFYKKCRVLNLQNQKLTEARDRLLPKLMSGEIEV